MSDTENARIWLGAQVLTAPLDTPIPTNLVTDWDDDFDDLGLLSQDGLTGSRSESSTDHFAYGNTLVRTTRRDHKRTFQVTALESNLTVLELVDPGSSVDTVGGVTTRIVKTPQKNERMFAFELLDGDVMMRRIIPRGEVTAVGDQVVSDNAISMYPLTISVYPYDFDADGIPQLFIEITDDPALDENFS